MTVTFGKLYDVRTANGFVVAIAQRGDCHTIIISDRSGGRLISLPVQRDIDHAARVIVTSMCLREALASTARVPDLLDDDRQCRGRWPEFLELWSGREHAPGAPWATTGFAEVHARTTRRARSAHQPARRGRVIRRRARGCASSPGD